MKINKSEWQSFKPFDKVNVFENKEIKTTGYITGINKYPDSVMFAVGDVYYSIYVWYFFKTGWWNERKISKVK